MEYFIPFKSVYPCSIFYETKINQRKDNKMSLTQDEITKIIRKYDSIQYGYTKEEDIIQFISESLDIPENIAAWMLNIHRALTELKKPAWCRKNY